MTKYKLEKCEAWYFIINLSIFLKREKSLFVQANNLIRYVTYSKQWGEMNFHLISQTLL